MRLLPELFKGGLTDAGADADLATDLAGVRIVLPQLAFTDELTLVKGGREIHLVHRPGSAHGAVWLELPAEQIVFTGDAVTNDVPPFLHDADLEAWLDNLALLQKKKYLAKAVVPGRGTVMDKEGVKDMEDFLKVVRRKVETLVRAHKTRLDAALAAPSLLEYFTVPNAICDHYTRRLRAGLEHIYDSLTASPSR